MKEKIKSYKDLRVYNNAMDAAMKIFELTKAFPAEEKHSLTDQLRRTSRSVCSTIGEAWRKRIDQAAFTARLSGTRVHGPLCRQRALRRAPGCRTQVLHAAIDRAQGTSVRYKKGTAVRHGGPRLWCRTGCRVYGAF